MDRTVLSCFIGACLISMLLAQTMPEGIERIGDDLRASRNGLDSKGSTMVASHTALSPGRVFAYRAFVRSLNAGIIQIWRETNETGSYRLVFETRFEPLVKDETVDIYLNLNFDGCPIIETGDRLGVYIESTPAPIATTVDGQAKGLIHSLETNETKYSIGDAVTFDPLPFPYALSLVAYIDTKLEEDMTPRGDSVVDCPRSIFIPEDPKPTLPPTTTTPAPTGRPGDTGARGPQGIRGPVGDTGPQGEAGMNGTRGPTGPEGPQGPAGKDANVTEIMGDTGPTGPSGDTGATGPAGTPGVAGQNGKDGKDGQRGPSGFNGTVIIRSNNTGNGGEAAPVTGEDDMWMTPMMIMGLYIWLIIVTVILFILCVSFCCYACCRNDKNDHEKEQAYTPALAAAAGTGNGTAAYVNVGYAGGDEHSSTDPDFEKKKTNRMSSFEPGEGWLGAMKADDTVKYENSTIERQASRKGPPAPLDELEPHIYENDGSGTGRKIPKTPDSTLNGGADSSADYAEVAVEVPSTPNYPSPPPITAEAQVNPAPNGDGPASPTTPNNRWSQSQDQMIAY